MRREDQFKELLSFGEQWKDIKEFSVFGFGQKCKNFLDAVHNDFKVLRYYDNDKNKIGQTLYKADVLAPEAIKQFFKKEKILITTEYNEISKQLKEYGLEENIDFCDINKFLCTIYWINENSVHIPEVHIALTTKCTLNCKHCNMFIPHYKNKLVHQNISNLIDTTKMFFALTDKVYLFQILGGEPFLYPQLQEYIDFLCKNYREKIVEVRLVTNGTVLPNKEVISLIKQYGIIVSMSDYSYSLPQVRQKFIDMEKILKDNDVKIMKPESYVKWKDFGFPHNSLNIPEDKLLEHMSDCSPVFRGLNDGKFYYCHLVWSAVKLGLLSENTSDYLDLIKLNTNNSSDKLKLIEYNLGFMDNGYVSLCRLCGGCGKSNQNFVDAAIQL